MQSAKKVIKVTKKLLFFLLITLLILPIPVFQNYVNPNYVCFWRLDFIWKRWSFPLFDQFFLSWIFSIVLTYSLKFNSWIYNSIIHRKKNDRAVLEWVAGKMTVLSFICDLVFVKERNISALAVRVSEIDETILKI